MQNKTLTPPKSLRSYLDILHGNTSSCKHTPNQSEKAQVYLQPFEGTLGGKDTC